MKIDLFCHILPPPYFERMIAISARGAYMQKRIREIPVMTDLELRFRMMDMFGDYVQVLSLAAPPIEALAAPDAEQRLLGVFDRQFAGADRQLRNTAATP